jgi:hypothetical protein
VPRGDGQGFRMRGRIWIATVGLVAMMLLCAVSSGAGAQADTWSVQSNGGFVSLDLLNTLQFAGGGSGADASNAPLAAASGTGVCLSTASSTNPCPTSPSSSLSGVASTTTQDAVANGNGVTASPTGSGSCTVPIDTGLVNVNVSCGSASAAEDGDGNPTASGSGSLANVSISLSLTDVLQSLLGGSLPSASSVCNDVPAASGTAGSNANPLSPSVQALLGTVNGILPPNLALNPTSVAGGSDVSGECSVLSGLLTQLNAASGASPVTGLVTGILNQVLGLTGGNAATVEPLTIDLGGSQSSVSTSGAVVTDSVTQHAVDVNLFGLADLQVAPTSASVAVDRNSGTVTPSCNAGLVSYSTSGSLPTFVSVTHLTSLVDQILAQIGASSALGSALGSLLTGIIDYTPDGNLLTCATTAPGPTASAKVGVVNLGLLGALQGGIGLNVGDVSVTGSSTNAVPAVATSPATATPAVAPAAVPNVTSVHTGEYWSGTLPILLMAGMGTAGLLLVGRRHVASLARNLNSPIRRRGGS